MMINVLTPFVISNVLLQVAIAICILGTCRGRPNSWWYAVFGVAYVVHSFVALAQLDMPILLAELSGGTSSASLSEIDSVRKAAEFWKLLVPAVSVSVGCSMIANFFSAKP